MSRAAGVGGALSLVGLLSSAGLTAQEPGEAARGWLGVGLQEVVECRAERGVREGCSELAKRLVVGRLVVDGPAERAGVQLGDTLLALDGRPLGEGLAAPAFAGLRPAVAAELQVGREGGRRTLRVVPAERPAGPVAIRVPTAGGTRVMRTGVGRPPAPRAGARPLAPLVLRVREGGVYQLHPQVEVVALGEGRYVSLDPGPELGALQDSIFRSARRRLDSLRRTFPGLEEMLAGNEARLRDVLGGRTGEAGLPRLALAAGFGRSVAGAEFEPLNPELAEFFEGAEEGLLCLRVVSGTPAERVGLRPGDVVVAAAGRPVAGVEELRAALRRAGARPLELRWIRKGRPMEGLLGSP